MFGLFDNVMINLMKEENRETLNFLEEILDSIYGDNYYEQLDEEDGEVEKEEFWESLGNVFEHPIILFSN